MGKTVSIFDDMPKIKNDNAEDLQKLPGIGKGLVKIIRNHFPCRTRNAEGFLSWVLFQF